MTVGVNFHRTLKIIRKKYRVRIENQNRSGQTQKDETLGLLISSLLGLR